jgi:hypothetical protein
MKKAQFAMEFLMTYGWVILVILIAIGALAYFGILDSKSIVPNQCRLSPGLHCKSYNVKITGASFMVSNYLHKDITIKEVEIVSVTQNCSTSSYLKSWIKADDSLSDFIASDSSIYGNTGSCNTTTCPLFTNSFDGSGAYYFDGNDDVLNLGGMDVIGNRLTIAAWFKSDNLANCGSRDCRIVSKSTSMNEQDHYWMLSTIRDGTYTRLRARLKTGSSTTTLIANSGSLSNNVWTHAAFVYDGNDMILYKDGVEVGRTSKSGTIATNNGVEAWIGNNPTDPKPWDGLIDDVRIYSKAFNSTEIAELANQTYSDCGNSCNGEVNIYVPSDESAQIDIDCSIPEGKLKTDLVVYYDEVGGLNNISNTGTLVAKVN